MYCIEMSSTIIFPPAEYLPWNEKKEIDELIEFINRYIHTVPSYDKGVIQNALNISVEWRLPSPNIFVLVYYMLKQCCSEQSTNKALLIKNHLLDKAERLAELDRYVPLKETDIWKKAFKADKLRRLFYTAYVDSELGLLALAIHVARMRLIKQHVDWLDHSSLRQLCEENDNVYIPFTELLGCWELRAEIGDLSLTIHNPQKSWDKISKKRDEILPLINNYFDAITNELQLIFRNEGITNTINPHVSSNSSLYSKTHNVTTLSDKLNQIKMDIIVNSTSDCYQVLRLIHNNWEPVLGRLLGNSTFRDLIATPKFTGYSCLTTKILFSRQEFTPRTVEFRLMTRQMEQINSYGILFNYLFDPNLKIRNAWWQDKRLREYVAENPIGSVGQTVYVFSPSGRIYKDLPKDSTPLDYGYKIHSEIGNHAKRIWINGRPSQHHQKLSNGDLVEIELDPNFAGPDRTWLKVVKSPAAITQIKRELSKRALPKGRQIIDKILKKEIALYELQDELQSDSWHSEFQAYLENLAEYLGYSQVNALYIDIAEDSDSLHDKLELSPDQIVARFISKKITPFIMRVDGKPIINPNRIRLMQCNHNKYKKRISPDTEIVGRIRNEQLLVYRKDCPDAPRNKDGIPLQWIKNPNLNRRLVKIEIKAVDQDRLLGGVLEIVYEEYKNGLYLLGVQASVDKNREAKIRMTVEATNPSQITTLEDKLNQLKQAGSIHKVSFNGLTSLEMMRLRDPDVLLNPYTVQAVSDPRLFKGRDLELREILKMINSDKNLAILYGINRVGKTSLLRYFCTAALAQEYKILPIFLDMQQLPEHQEQRFWLELKKNIISEISRNFPGRKFHYRHTKSSSNPYENFMNWLSGVDTTLLGRKIVIVVDELNIVDEQWDLVEAKRFIHRIKSLIENQQKIKFIVCAQKAYYMQARSKSYLKSPSSSPLLSIASFHIPIDFLDKISAEKLIRDPMGQMLRFEDGVVERMLFLTACHPYYLQFMLHEIVNCLNDEKRNEVTINDVDVITKKILDSDHLLFYTVLQQYSGFKRFVLSALATLATLKADSVLVDDIENTLKAKGVDVMRPGLIAALEDLANHSIIKRNDGDMIAYSFRVPLFGMWLLKNKPLDLLFHTRKTFKSTKNDYYK